MTRSIDVLVLRRAGVAAALVGLAGIVLGAVFAGWPGALGGLVATGIVLVFFTAGQLTLGRVLRTNPQMAMTAALTIYLVKVGVLFIFILLFAGTTAFDTKVFALTVVAATIAWTVAEVWVFSTAKVLYVDPAEDSNVHRRGGLK